MKCKIGMATWHYYSNFGSSLQAYAIQKVISNLGYSSEFINYRNVKFQGSKLKDAAKYLLSYISFMFPQKMKVRYSYKFIRFQYNFLKQSKRIYSVEDLKKYNSKYDVFICGSDQIWAPNVFNPVYFLSFVERNKPKIAYAPSIGLDCIPKELHNNYKKLLKRFYHLSIREKKGAEIVKSISGLDAEVVLDPSFLLDKKDWEGLSIEPSVTDDFILCYFLAENNYYKEIIKKVYSQFGCKIISISQFYKDSEFINIKDKFAGPREFLGYIKKAKIILTDSFHGMAFSIILNKNFYVLERFKNDDPICQNSRIYNIINQLGLDDRLIKYNDFNDSKINDDKIDYYKVNKLLETQKEKSLSYLKESISKYCPK